MQAQDFAETLWAVGQRLQGWNEDDVLGAFQRGEIVRTHILRPTWHFVAPDDLSWMQALTAKRVQQQNARIYNEQQLDAKELEKAVATVRAALEDAGRPLTRPELGVALERDNVHASGVRLAYVVMYAELECAVCSGPMRGRQHTYVLSEEVVPAGPSLAGEEALAELARRYFLSRGPATIRDFAWWSSLTIDDCRAAIDFCAGDLAEETSRDGASWFSDPHAPPEPPKTGAILLANVDESIVAYQDLRIVQTRPGVLDPPWDRILLIDGLAVGRWRRDLSRRQVRVEIELAEVLGTGRRAKVLAEVRRFEEFLGRETAVEIRQL